MKRSIFYVLGGIMAIGAVGMGGWLVMSQPVHRTNTTAIALPTAKPQPTSEYLSVDQVPGITMAELQGSASASLERMDPDKLFTVVTTGDVIPARGVDAQIRKHGADFPFADDQVRDLLSKADWTIVNLEAPLIASCPVIDAGFTLCGLPAFAGAMAKAGIDVATLENNHIGNFDTAGIEETIKHLTDAHIDYATSSRLATTTIKGTKLGVLAFNGIGGRFYPDQITAALQQARPQVDLLFVAFHWGKEYELLPQPAADIAPDDPRTIGHLAVDAGADLVIGNHPHWVQGDELYKGKLINYALGNFIFDQSWSTETQQGVVGSYTFYGKKLVKADYTPIHIYNQAQPRLAQGSEAATIMSRMHQSTAQINGLAQ